MNASDVHYSNEFDQFVGPDGNSYIWCYLPSLDGWVVGSQERNAALYPAILAFNTSVVQDAGCAPGCSCVTGDE